MKLNSRLALVGTLAFAISVAYFWLASAPDPAPASPLQQHEPAVPVEPVVDATTALPKELVDGLSPAEREFLAMDDRFDDASYPEPDDELLIIEPGDPTRYITATDIAEDRTRRQHSREASLNASTYVGDARVRAIGALGRYAGDGNIDALTELRRILKSRDNELRADALEALAELLPHGGVVPSFSSEPLADDQVDSLIQALQERESS